MRRRLMNPKHYFTSRYWSELRAGLSETRATTNAILDAGGSLKDARAASRRIQQDVTRRVVNK